MSGRTLTPEKRSARAELRLAQKAYDNAEHRLRAARENLRFASNRLAAAHTAVTRKAANQRAADQAYHGDIDGDLEGYDGA